MVKKTIPAILWIKEPKLKKRIRPKSDLPTGRPTKYKESYCQDLLDFMSRTSHEVVVDTTYYKVPDNVQKNLVENGVDIKEMPDGTLKSATNKLIANTFPTFQRRCHNIWIHIDTMKERVSKYPNFSLAYKKSKQIQESILLENAMQWEYNANFAMFMAKNNFWYKDSKDITIKDQSDQEDSDDLTEEQILEKLKKVREDKKKIKK